MRHFDKVLDIAVNRLLSEATNAEQQAIIQNDIVRMHENGYSAKYIADRYNMTVDEVYDICKNAERQPKKTNKPTIQSPKSMEERSKEAIISGIIRSLLAGKTYREVADQYNTDPTSISKIVMLAKELGYQDAYRIMPPGQYKYKAAKTNPEPEIHTLEYDDIGNKYDRPKKGRKSAKLPNNEIINSYERGLTIAQLASKYAVSIQMIRRILKDAQNKGLVTVRPRGAIKKINDKEVIKLNEIINSYKKGLTIAQLASKYAVSISTIRRILKDAQNKGLVTVRRKGAIKKINDEEVIKLYNNGDKIIDIAKKLGVSDETINRALNKARQEGRITSRANRRLKYESYERKLFNVLCE